MINKVTLRQLEYLVAVGELGSVSAAADRLHVSPSAISVALTDLESELRVRLTLRRRSKGVTLTPSGVQALHQARTILEEAARLTELAATIRGELVGPLRVGCFTTLSPLVLPGVAEYFTRNHPEVELEFLEGSPDLLQQRLLEGVLDACVLFGTQVNGPVDAVELVHVRPQLVLPAEHRLASRDEIPLRELANEDAVLLALYPITDLVEQALRGTGFEPRVRWRVANAETLRSIVSRGLAYSVTLGRPQGFPPSPGAHVVYKAIADPVPENSIVVAHLRGTTTTEKTKALIKHCLASMREADQPHSY